jgi:hypothetical protein
MIFIGENGKENIQFAMSTAVPVLAGTILFPKERLGKTHPYECQTNIYVCECTYCGRHSQSGDFISACPHCGAPL